MRRCDLVGVDCADGLYDFEGRGAALGRFLRTMRPLCTLYRRLRGALLPFFLSPCAAWPRSFAPAVVVWMLLFGEAVGAQNLAEIAMPADTVKPPPGAATSDDPSAFTVYDATRYLDKPPLTRFGLVDLPVVYGAQIWGGRPKHTLLPTRRQVETAVRRRIPTGTDLVVLDIEHWPWRLKRVSSASLSDTVEKFRAVMREFRALRPETRFGYYSVVPLRDYHCSLKEGGHPCYDTWREEGRLYAPLIHEVDALFPSLYTFFEDRDAWRDYAIRHVKEARRLAPDKPVYPFIWPATHHMRKGELRYIEPSYWLLQLHTLAEHADGIVIWGGFDPVRRKREVWSDQAPWWRVTVDWLASRRPPHQIDSELERAP